MFHLATAYKSSLRVVLAASLKTRKMARFIRTAVLNFAVLCAFTRLTLCSGCSAAQCLHCIHTAWQLAGETPRPPPPSAASEVINFTLVGVWSHSWSVVKSRRAGIQREREKGKTIPAISSGNTAALYSNQPLYMLNNSSCLACYISSLRCGKQQVMK